MFEGGLAFVPYDGKALFVLDLRREEEIARVPLSGWPDVLWLSHAKGHYCAIGGPGAIGTTRPSVIESAPTEEGAHTLTFDGERQRLYSFLSNANCVAVYSEE